MVVVARANVSWPLRGGSAGQAAMLPSLRFRVPALAGGQLTWPLQMKQGLGQVSSLHCEVAEGKEGPAAHPPCAAGPAALHCGSSSLPPKLSPARTFLLHLPPRVSQLWPTSGQVHPSMQALGLHWPGRPWASVRRGPAGFGGGLGAR